MKYFPICVLNVFEPNIEQGSAVYNLSLFIGARRLGLRVCTRLPEDNDIYLKHSSIDKGLVAELGEASTAFSQKNRGSILS